MKEDGVDKNGNGTDGPDDDNFNDDREQSEAYLDELRWEKLSIDVQQFLAECAAKEINVPDELQSLLSSVPGDSVSSGSLRRSELLDSFRSSIRSSYQSQGSRTSFVNGSRVTGSYKDYLARSKVVLSQKETELVRELKDVHSKLKTKLPEYQLRVKDGSYTVTNYYNEPPPTQAGEEPGPRRAKQHIPTVVSTNVLVKLTSLLWKCLVKGEMRKIALKKKIMQNTNLVLESGKMYLVLGAPGSGKSTLLKMIANLLPHSKQATAGGMVTLNSIRPGKGVYWSKLVAYMDQIDRLHPYLTVKETFNFAWMCRSGGTHRRSTWDYDDEGNEMIKKMDEERFTINKVMEGLGLKRVENTFVGDQERVRGVSGGEKKRVTVGEMLCCGVPVLCCDEISTGLDSATTYDITRLFGAVSRINNSLNIVSLLQPPPETVANFDEIILLSEGRVIYSGPVDQVLDHFSSLGYEIPDRMDLADWLQALPTSDGWRFLKGADRVGAHKKEFANDHLTPEVFQEKFYASRLGKAILDKLEAPLKTEDNDYFSEVASVKFANPFYKSLALLAQREALLWWRDKYFIKTKVFQTILMGVIVGTLFYQSTYDPSNVFSIAFQSMFYSVISAMVLLRKQFPDRSMLYKHQDANFFPTWTYVAGKSIAQIPTALIDAIGYGSFIFWLSGMAYNNGANIGQYFIFMLLMFVTGLSAGLVFSVYSAVVKDITIAQAYMSVTAIVIVLFSGFTVQPNVIPVYYIWIYWGNCFAWLLRGFIINEFISGAYNEPGPTPGYTQGEYILVRFGMTINGEPFTFDWLWWGILVSIGTALIMLMVSVYCLNHVRFATGKSLITDKGSEETEPINESDIVRMPFKSANLTFKNVRYVVKASTSDEKLELLKGVDGVVEAGKMTALMGSSGAGKTTLMDVLAMRKTSGEISGDIRVNGHPQKEKSFRRCAGYVEQFDVQSPQLTIRETVHFSAKMRLEQSDPAVTKESTHKFVNQILYMLELTNQQDLQVGSDESGGLSFEQKKRLSIAVECAANPSILFLDEPTSGLDARAAAIVMRGMKRIAQSGRAVCATIHQPSIAIFNDFDSLLLLKRGGEVVYFGDMGECSSNLIQYLERYNTTPKIMPGENPATWMLQTIGAGTAAASGRMEFDYAAAYAISNLRKSCLERIDQINASATAENLVTFPSMYATSKWAQNKAVFQRMMKIYFRSPGYNGVRLTVSTIVALLFSTVYASQRVPQNESDMNSRVNSIFIALTFLNANAMNSALRVIERERNMFYRHKAARMYNPTSITTAFTSAEIPFIILAAALFCVVFYFLMGFEIEAGKFFWFFLFVALGLGTFTFLGHMLALVFRDSTSAQGLGGILLTCNSLFSGVFIKPQQIPMFWIFLYWILPGHWIIEGLIISQFGGQQTQIEASQGTAFYKALNCTSEPCHGSIGTWIDANFVDWSHESIKWNVLYLVGLILLTRVIGLYALFNINYRST